MSYAIIGSGAIGSAIAGQFALWGTPVAVANARGPATIAPLARELGEIVLPTEVAEALKADIVILAVPFDVVPVIMKAAGPWNGRIVVDATNAYHSTDFSPADLGGRPSTDIVADAAPGARVVKAFNHNWARVLARPARDEKGGRRVLFVSGNHPSANAEVAAMMTAMGFAPVDLGRTDEGGRLQQFGGALTVLSLISQEQGGASLPQMDLVNP